MSTGVLPEVLRLTPIDGMHIKGWPDTVVSRGRIVVEKGQLKVEPGSGKFIQRSPGYDFIRPVGISPPEINPEKNFGAKII